MIFYLRKKYDPKRVFPLPRMILSQLKRREKGMTSFSFHCNKNSDIVFYSFGFHNLYCEYIIVFRLLLFLYIFSLGP